mgnify:CR=1 FL=1
MVTSRSRNSHTFNLLYYYIMLDLDLSATTALTPLDGRYGSKVKALRPIFSEFGLIKYRSLVEVRWLQALAQEANIPEVPAFSDETNAQLDVIIDDFSVSDAEAVKAIEATTNHDVKAVEYFLKQRSESIPEVKAVIDENGMQIAGTPMAIYHTFEMKTGKVICDIAVPVVDAQSVDGFISGALFGQSYLRTTAKGEYSNLEKAWHSAFGHARMFKRKIDMTKPMVERYASDPETNNGLDVVTYIDLPLK